MRRISVTPRLESRPFAVSATGAVGVLLIHALLVLPFVLKLSLPTPRHPNITGAGATALVSSAEPEMTAVFIDEPASVKNPAAPMLPALASRGMTPPDLQLMVLSPDPSPAATNARDSSDDEDSSTSAAADHARLYGRYVGQVQARIERAWMRPRTAIGAPRFSCRARIQQNRRGQVIDVKLDHCNGTQLWQQSLLSSIRTASPLPAPPDVSVYADVLWLSLSSEPFREARSTQGFEPEAPSASTVGPSVLESFRDFVNGGRSGPRQHVKDKSQVFHLTIIGTPSRETAVSNEATAVSPPFPPAEPPALAPLPQ